MSALLARLLEALLSIFPRLAHIPCTNGAVKFSGKRATEWGAGWHLYWPLLSTYSEVPVVTETNNLQTQVVQGAGQQSVAASGVVVYRAVDVMKALTQCADLDDIVGDVGRCAVLECLANKKTAALKDDLGSGRLTKALTTMARKRLKPYGVSVTRCSLTDFATCRPVFLLGEGASTGAVLGEE